MSTQTKLRREIEPKWVAEYVAEKYPNAIVKLRCPLGGAPASLVDSMGEAAALRLYRPSRPEADAVILEKRRILVIEAKIFKFMDGLAKLPVYKSLVPSTPELADFARWPVDMQLLVAAHVDWVDDAALKQGIQIVDYAPPWVTDIWNTMNVFWTMDAVDARDAKKATLAKLGY